MNQKKQSNEEVFNTLSPNRHDSFADEFPYPILRLDDAGFVLYANKASLPILLAWGVEVGYKVPSEIQGILNQVLDDGIAAQIDVAIGTTLIELTFSLVQGFRLVNIYGSDVTGRRYLQEQLEESERNAVKARDEAHLAKISLERAEIIGKHGSWEWNIQHKTFQCSKGFLFVFGWTEEQVVTRGLFFESIHRDDRRLFASAMEDALRSKNPFSCNYRVHSIHEKEKWIHSEGHALFNANGQPWKLIGTVQDVTEKVVREIELTEATIKAESATRTKAEFLANMSHEIRTPMNGVIGMCHLLLDTVKDPVQKGQLTVIQNCGNSLLELLNDILDFSKLEVGKIQMEQQPFSLNEVAVEIVQLLNPKAIEKNIQLSYEAGALIPHKVIGDSTRFRQVLTNLVSNAIKFTERGGVRVVSSADKQPEDFYSVQFSIIDTGIGIPENVHHKIFQSFSQADLSTTRKFGGSGLGLAICKGLVEQMKGKIWFESQEKRGSTFHFSMVLKESQESSIKIGMGAVSSFNSSFAAAMPWRILIAEDNHVNQLVINGFLEKLGYHPEIVSNGLEVLERLSKEKFDFIFMDVHMPEMDGIETTKAIHQRYQGKMLPKIVALTASTMKEEAERCYAAGMVDFVSKPVQLSELVRVLRSEKQKIQAA